MWKWLRVLFLGFLVYFSGGFAAVIVVLMFTSTFEPSNHDSVPHGDAISVLAVIFWTVGTYLVVRHSRRNRVEKSPTT
jgi:hypothetical protein